MSAAPTHGKVFPNMEDGVEPHANLICSHMNSDHADAVAHLAMFHGRLNALPVWSSMDAISRTSVTVSYKLSSGDAAQSVVFALDPPIESVMDSRRRLADMSKSAEEANAALLHQNHPSVDSEVLIMGAYAFATNPVVFVAAVLSIIAIFFPTVAQQICSFVAWLGGDGVTGYASRMVARLLGFFMGRVVERKVFVLSVITPAMIIQAFALTAWLSRRWRNAPSVSETGPIGWIFGVLTSSGLPALDELGWRAQIVVITGGAQGLGAEVALQLAQKGAKVVSLDVSKMTVSHENISSYVCDVSKFANVAAVAKSVIKHHGPPTVLINNCGIRNGGTVLDVSADAMEKLVDTNLMSHFWTIKAFLPVMVERGRGHIVTVSSVFGYTGVANLADYVASKHALVGLHQSLRFELDSIHKTPFVRTTLVAPGHMSDTRMFADVHYNSAARFFSPSTTKNAVAARIVKAIGLQESTVIEAPAFVAWTPVLNMLPSFARDLVQQILGANHSLPISQ
ncbi:hypothetical protein MCUN1_000363 [Malassezia cuniculi]|uniref:DUF2470 domain-containing protein n=1 Tax=Malassezia cuniculi TaxID=948313 RepID=A0AAF0ENV5_9BASI|nr:hypothetical protein MCUN1_000363 [Malassezia cuniculi]